MQREVRAAPQARLLRGYAMAAARPGAEVTVRVVGASEARRLNRIFRRRNYAPNVLSFSYDARRGDVVLCHPVISREAKAQGKTLVAHYAHLVVHGMLHLRGHDHRRAADAARMERAERRLLRRLGFADPYAVE
ncbi:MAG: rRNA maturation RNase YbeY [Burkholderiales bacterium]